jgi:glycosidase
MGRPWLPLGSESDHRNVASQRADPDSVLACYHRLLAARAAQPSLQDGSLELVDVRDSTALAYRRLGSGAEVLVMIAFDRAGATVTLPAPRNSSSWRPIVGTHRDLPPRLASNGTLLLRPFEALVVVAER